MLRARPMRRTSGWWRSNRGRMEKPLRITATAGRAQKATTPSVVPPARTRISGIDSSSDGGLPLRMNQNRT